MKPTFTAGTSPSYTPQKKCKAVIRGILSLLRTKKNIRKKLGLTNTKVHLTSYLQKMEKNRTSANPDQDKPGQNSDAAKKSRLQESSSDHKSLAANTPLMGEVEKIVRSQ